MTCIKQKFVSLNLSNKFSSINIDDDIQSPVLGNRVVQAIPSSTFTVSYMFQNFRLVFCPSVSLPDIIIAIFSLSYCVFSGSVDWKENWFGV